MGNVAVIISNYNYGEFVLDAIQSVMDQTYKCNIVIVDDGSTDNSTYKIRTFLESNSIKQIDGCIGVTKSLYYSGIMDVKEYEHGITLIEIKNSGASTARNVGIWHAWHSSDYFAILDADDTYHPNKVETLLGKIQEFNEIGVAYADYDIMRPSYIKREFKKPYDKKGLELECIVHSGALIKKQYLQKVTLPNDEFYDSKLHGPGSQEFIGCTEDYDLWLRLSNVCMFCHVPESLSLVKELGHNQSLKMNHDIFMKNMKVIQQRE